MLLPDSTVLQKQPLAHYLLSWPTAVDVCKQHLRRSLAKGHQPRHPLCPKGNFWSSHVCIPTIELTSFHASFYKLISECSVTRLQSDSDCPRIATCCRALVTSIRSPFSDSHDCTIAWGSSAFFSFFFFADLSPLVLSREPSTASWKSQQGNTKFSVSFNTRAVEWFSFLIWLTTDRVALD